MRYLIYDDECSFCSYIVQRLSSLIETSLIVFIPFKSSKGKELIDYYNIENIDSVIYVDNKKNIYLKATAVLNVCKMMRFPYNLLYLFHILPNSFLNIVYDFFARNRSIFK